MPARRSLARAGAKGARRLLRPLVICATLMIAIAVDDGVSRAYDRAVTGVYYADCLLLGYLVGWANVAASDYPGRQSLPR